MRLAAIESISDAYAFALRNMQSAIPAGEHLLLSGNCIVTIGTTPLRRPGDVLKEIPRRDHQQDENQQTTQTRNSIEEAGGQRISTPMMQDKRNRDQRIEEPWRKAIEPGPWGCKP
ncbi:MAG: hypothetical protein IPH26_15795 [Sterolibacteriaceae bacterium]|uniref:Uncharacterized protein n=1 Tax=Candidatus Methylophosphatis roskildensis TaxID=2899263 RepID=A0A9D7E0G5_9PROT|nr:hypothetical protein [Candidatus Methylophosphatis roskildensis]